MKKETIEKFEKARVIELYTKENWTVTKIAKEIDYNNYLLHK